MIEELEVDRDAIVEVYRLQNLGTMTQAVAAGDVTQAEAVGVHEAFMQSEALQKLVSIDVAMLDAWLKGQEH